MSAAGRAFRAWFYASLPTTISATRHVRRGSTATTASGDSGGIVWSGAAWLTEPVTPEAACPSERAKLAAHADVLASAMQQAAKGSERAAVMLQNYSHAIMMPARPLGWAS